MAKGNKGKKRPPAKRPGGSGASAGGRSPAKPAANPPVRSDRHASDAAKTTTAPTTGKQTRTERMEAARQARRRKQLQTRVLAIGVPLLVVVMIASVMVLNRRNARAAVDRLTSGSCTFDRRADRTSSTPHNPVPQGYSVNPPAGGNHDPTPIPAGDYDGAELPPDNKLVHSLEHGLVILWHRPDISDKDKARLHKIFEDHPDDVIVVPRPSLQPKVAATAWGRRLLCTEIEPAHLRKFITLYRNQSPEAGTR